MARSELTIRVFVAVTEGVCRGKLMEKGEILGKVSVRRPESLKCINSKPSREKMRHANGPLRPVKDATLLRPKTINISATIHYIEGRAERLNDLGR